MDDFCKPLNITFEFSSRQSRLAANMTIVGYTIFVMICATGFVIYKKKLSKEDIKETLQVAFNAGGHMTMSLMASTVLSQATWSANLLGSATAGVQVSKFFLSLSWKICGSC